MSIAESCRVSFRLTFIVVCLAFITAHGPAASGAETAADGTGLAPISLASDEWRFSTDADDVGVSQTWWLRELPGTTTIALPGSMTEAGLGNDITTTTPWTQEQPRLAKLMADPKLQPYLQPGNVKIPFWLTPLKYYKGAAWYQREIMIPDGWADQGVTLYLERPHWRTDVWVDGERRGFRDGLSTPHEYVMGRLEPGRHRLTIRVDNRMQAKVGLNAHSVTDHTQTNWNGIVGDIELRPRRTTWISDVQVYPDVENRLVRVVTKPAGRPGSNDSIEVKISRRNSDNVIASVLSPIKIIPELSGGPTVETVVRLEEPVELWDEFDRNLYEARVRFVSGSEAEGEEETITFGFRDFATSGTEFIVNGRPTFLRGTLECCIFPLTGYPPMEVAPWRHIMEVLKAHGLNHIRFHSWCPPEAAFVAADEAGVYLSVECASWSQHVGDPDYMEWLYAESHRIVDEYGNHPSFCMFLYGNEPAGEPKKRYMDTLDEFVGYWDKLDSRFLVSGGAGWPWLPNNEFYITQKPRIQHWGEGLKSRVNSKPPETVTDYYDYVHKFEEPVISHEIGQWCVYPKFNERAKYTGVTRALNFDIFEDTLTKNHMRDQADEFVMASGKLQALLYKEDIESALRTKGMGGFQLLDLHDFPGQGTALVGVLDPFWDGKGYISAEEYRRFTGPVVPLASLSKRVFTNDENLTCTVELANYGPEMIKGATALWTLERADGEYVASGKFPPRDLPVGNDLQLGLINQPLTMIADAEKLTLRVYLNGLDIMNSWDVWVYLAEIDTAPPADILVAHELDTSAMDHLASGGKVLLIPDPEAVKGDVVSGFSSIFWNTAWTGGQAPHTLGILCDPDHPALAEFPTNFHSNWQWWYLTHDSPCMLLDGLTPGVRPIVQMIDDWTKNRRLGYLLETKYHGGKLMICSMKIAPAEADDPVSKQMLYSVLKYMDSGEFDPQDELSAEQMGTVLKLPAETE